MKIFAGSLFACTALAGMAHAQMPAFPPTAPSILNQATVSLGAVEALPDVGYSTLPGFRPLKLDLYKARQSGAPVPLVIFMHGGGWQGGNPRGGPIAGTDGPTLFAALAGRGYVVASISYRFTGEAKFPAQVHDMRAAIRFLREHASDYGIDGSKVFLTGASAGAYLAALGGVSCGVTELDPASPAPAPGVPPRTPPVAGSECVQGVVSFYPPVDLKALAVQPSMTAVLDGLVTSLLGCQIKSCAATQLALAEVLGRVSAKTPPFLIIHGDADTLVSIDQSRELEKALKAKGVPVELMVVPGVNHVFIGADAAQQKAITERFFAFLDRQSGKRP